MDWATFVAIVTGGVIAAGAGLLREIASSARNRREGHRDELRDAVVDFLAADRARLNSARAIVKATDRYIDGGGAGGVAEGAQDDVMAERAPHQSAERASRDALARIYLFDDEVFTAASAVVSIEPSPSTPTAAHDTSEERYAKAIKALRDETRRAIKIA